MGLRLRVGVMGFESLSLTERLASRYASLRSALEVTGQSSMFRVKGSEFKVQIFRFNVQCSKFRVQSLEFRVQCSEFRVQDSELGRGVLGVMLTSFNR